jgi:hypothetical protein
MTQNNSAVPHHDRRRQNRKKGSRDRSAASDGEADHSFRYQRQGAAGGKTVAKVLRSDARGNLRLLISSGTSAQELCIITTMGNFLAGDR